MSDVSQDVSLQIIYGTYIEHKSSTPPRAGHIKSTSSYTSRSTNRLFQSLSKFLGLQ